MIPQTPSTSVPPDSSAQGLLRRGPPFVEFPRFSILHLQCERDGDGNPVPFSEWLTKRLQIGRPFVIQDFDKLDVWEANAFSIERLIELSTQKSTHSVTNARHPDGHHPPPPVRPPPTSPADHHTADIPIRNCSTGRDLSFTLRKFADAARQKYQEFQNLYARDLPCPDEWQEQCRRILPTEVQWGGRLDLFQWLPPCARSEVMMAYVGSEGSSSGFHRCFSSTVALNLLVDSDGERKSHRTGRADRRLTQAADRPVVCIGTDFESQKKYDAFMCARGISPTSTG